MAFLLLTMPAAGQQQSSPEEAYRKIQDEFVQGNLKQAEVAVETATSRWSRDRRWADLFRVQAAHIALYQGDSPRVLALLERPVFCGPSVTERNLYLSLAYARAGHAERARLSLAAATITASAAKMQAELAFSKGNLALELGEVARAKQWYEHALPLAQRQRKDFLVMQVRGNLGVVALRQERFEVAQDLFQQAGATAQSLKARLAQEKYLGSAASALYSTGDFSRSRALFVQAAQQAIALGASVDQVRWSNNLGLCEWRLHHLPQARAAFEEALRVATKIGNEEQAAEAHVDLGALFAETNSSAAEQHAKAALAIAQHRGNVMEALPARTLLACLQVDHGRPQAWEGAGAELRRLLHEPALTPSLRWQIEGELGRLARARGELQQATLLFQRAITTFARQRRALASVDYQIPFGEAGTGLLNDYLDNLIAAGDVWRALRVLDESRAVALHVRSTAPAAPRTLYTKQLAQRANGTILIYYIRPQRSFLWAIGPHKRSFYSIPGEDALRPLIARHQAAILDSRDLSGTVGEAGRALFAQLIAPAAEVIDTSRIFLVSDGDLATLNFETLLTPGSKSHFWIEDAAVINARSLREVDRATRPTVVARSPNLLLLSNAISNDSALPDLRSTGEEIEQVASHFHIENRTLLRNAGATPAAYRASKPVQYQYLHFIAHGTANEVEPLRSAMLLAGDPEHSRLYARDVLTQPLRAELVTLSSCFGSGIRAYSGEGPVGMAWAFQRAGARHVIGALWQLSDTAGPLLMGRLYDGLTRGMPPDQALREAKLALLHGPGVLRKPFYWAPLVLY